MSIKWRAPYNDGGTSVVDYRIEMKAPIMPWIEIAINLPYSVFVKTGLSAGSEYKFRIQARNSIGYGPFSEELVILAGAPPDRPVKPLIQITDKSLDINWIESRSSGLEVTDYKIELITFDSVNEIDRKYCENGSFFYVMRDTFCSVSLETLHNVFNLEEKEANISVNAINEIGESETSKWSSTVWIPKKKISSKDSGLSLKLSHIT